MKIGTHVIHTAIRSREFIEGKWHSFTERRDVILIAVSGRHAMVKRPYCIPYVANLKELSGRTTEQATAIDLERGEK